jgi:perosamine synthetase
LTLRTRTLLWALRSPCNLGCKYCYPIARMPCPTDTSQSDALERELAGRFGARYAIAVFSGTAALHTALVAAGIGSGDVPAATVMMTVAAIAAAGAHPVFVDSPPGRLGMDAADAAGKIGPRTRAILVVHLFGRTDGLDRAVELARDHNLVLIEDACQAQGSRHRGRDAGTVGDIGCFSLKDGKTLASGEGGYLLTDDDTVAPRAASWRNNGLTPAPEFPQAPASVTTSGSPNRWPRSPGTAWPISIPRCSDDAGNTIR